MTITRMQEPRQLYGLGSLVKSVTKGIKGAVKGAAKGIKSFAKSDLGKAALIIGGGMYAGGLGPFAATARFGTIPGAGFASGLGSGVTSALEGIGLSKKGIGTLKAFTIGSLGSALLSAAEAGGLDTSDPNAQVDLESLTGYLSRGYKNLNPNATDEEVFQFVQENTAEYRADGGRIGYASGSEDRFMELVSELREKGFSQQEAIEEARRILSENKAMGGRIMRAMGDSASDNAMQAAGIEGLPVRQNSKGVKELDLRKTGGFIPPVGVKEKADDIPAMLSNNEFVFTADAVRAAGGGSVDKGAQRMYETMKQLESRVA